MRPKLLDLFCGAGGASVGYHRAGFDVVGVDIEPMRDYPFKFYQGDALDFVKENAGSFAAVHASPPCQTHSAMQHIHKNKEEHQDLIDETRAAINGMPYIIENVVGAPLIDPTMLCGTMFGLNIIRHRLFECNWGVAAAPEACNHSGVYDPWHGKGRTANKFRAAMGIDWMRDAGGGKRRGTLSQAIPPAYTEWLGKQLMVLICAKKI